MPGPYTHTNSKGTLYYLHSKQIAMKNTGREMTIYFFSKKVEDAVSMPDGYTVVENSHSGLPFLKKV